MISWFHLLKVLAFLAVCLHLSVCIRVSVHRCNAYVISSTLLTAYRSLISLAMPSRSQSRGQSLSLSPSPVSNCELEHLQNARIAHRASRLAHRTSVKFLRCSRAMHLRWRCNYNLLRQLQWQQWESPALSLLRSHDQSSSSEARPLPRFPFPPLAACLLCDYYKLENNRLSP